MGGIGPLPETAPLVIKAEFLTGSQSVRTVLAKLRAELSEAGLAAGLVETSELVLAEIFNNIEEHAYRGVSGGPVAVSILLQAKSLEIEVSDAGIRLPGGLEGRGDLPDLRAQCASGLPEGGWGWALIRALATGIDYQRNAGKNVLRFRIVLS